MYLAIKEKWSEISEKSETASLMAIICKECFTLRTQTISWDRLGTGGEEYGD